jgi:hypothetical protein
MTSVEVTDQQRELGVLKNRVAVAGAERVRDLVPVRAPLIPVLAEVSGAYPAGLLTSASVKVYDLSARRTSRSRPAYPCTTRHSGPFLVGTGKTGSRGVAIVGLCERNAPARLRVVVSGGLIGRARFHGTMIVQLNYAAHHAVYVNPLSTLVARDLIAHPRRHSVAGSQALVRRFLGLPSFFDFAGDLADRQLFDGARFLASANAHGGFDRYVARLVSQLAARKPAAVTAATTTVTTAPAGAQCWRQAAQSTGAFAKFLGFQSVPAEGLPTPQPCTVGSSQDLQTMGVGLDSMHGDGAFAHAAGLGPNDIFSDLMGIAGLSYSVFSGNGSSHQLSAIQSSINQIQGEMVAVQNTLAQLQTQIANVNANVLQGNVSDLAADAQPTVDRIKTDGEDVRALVGALYQLVCPKTVCTKMRLQSPGNVTAAFNALCYPNLDLAVAPESRRLQ